MRDMNPFDLQGKVAIVTGGNGGIGLGIARGLAQAGADIVICGRNSSKIDAAVAELRTTSGRRVIGVTADVADAEAVSRLVDATLNEYGGVDILVANAGFNSRKRPEAYTLADWHHIVDTNLTGTFTCCQAVYPAMRSSGGSIITIGSMTSLFGFDVAAVYAASKGAVVQLTKSLAAAWATDGIRVNCLLPGWIDTDLTRGARAAFPQLHEDVVRRTPFRRWGRPDDLAGAAVFLCSPASEFITGVALPIDGGFSSSMF